MLKKNGGGGGACLYSRFVDVVVEPVISVAVEPKTKVLKKKKKKKK